MNETRRDLDYETPDERTRRQSRLWMLVVIAIVIAVLLSVIVYLKYLEWRAGPPVKIPARTNILPDYPRTSKR